MRIGRWSELSVDSVCHQEHEVMRDANETSCELGSAFGGNSCGAIPGENTIVRSVD